MRLKWVTTMYTVKELFLPFKVRVLIVAELQSFVVLLAVIYGVAERKIAQRQSVSFAILILLVVMGMVAENLRTQLILPITSSRLGIVP